MRYAKRKWSEAQRHFKGGLLRGISTFKEGFFSGANDPQRITLNHEFCV